MQVLIVEDESFAADRLEELLKQLEPGYQVVGRTTSVKASVAWLSSHQADLIFLDIQLSDGLSFSIFEQVQVSTPVIFTTAYDEYALRAFELNSVAYLLKPIRADRLRESLEKYKSMKSAFNLDVAQLLATFHGQRPVYKKRFLIRIGDQLKKLEASEIAYCFALEKSVFARTFDNKTLPMDQSLDVLEAELDPERFFRINRRYLVSMEAVDNMIAWSRSRIKLDLKPRPEDPLETIVSINRSHDFKKWMGGTDA
jgi:DNA-binding LytR/AlgR family response regulator